MKKLLALFIFCSGVCAVNAQVHDLDYFLTNGLTNSPLMQDYSGQLKYGAIDSSLLTATRKPQVDGSAMLMYAPVATNFGYDAAITNGGNYDFLVAVSQPLFAKNIYAPQYEAFRIANQSVGNSSKVSAHELQKQITDEYIAAYSSLNILRYNQSLLTIMQSEETVLHDFVSNGIYRQVDYLAFEVEKQTQEMQISQLRIQYRTDLNQLRSTCGITDTAFYELPSPAVSESALTSGISPFQLQFHIDSLRIVNSRSTIDMRYHSQVKWFADAGMMTSTPATFYRNFGASFGVSLSVPLYDGHQRGLEYQKLNVAEDIRANYQRFFTMQQQLNIQNFHSQIAALDQLIIQQKALLKTSETLLNADKELLDKGQASVSDFILAVKSNADIRNQLAQSELSRLQLINQLNYWNW